MSRPLKIALIVCAAVAALFVVTAVAAVVFFPAEKVKALAEKSAGEAVGLPVHVGKVGLSFAGIPSIKAGEITVGSPADGEQPLVSVSSIKVRVNLLKLLKKEVEVVLVEIDKPAIMMITRADGSSNTPPKKEKPAGAKEPSKSLGFSLPIPVSLNRLIINDGSLVIDTSASKHSLTAVTGLDTSIKLAVKGGTGAFTSSGTVSIDDIALTDTVKNTSITGVRVTFDYEATGSAADGSLNLTKGALVVNGIPVAIGASVTNVTQAAFSAKTETLDIATVLKALPAGLVPNADKLAAEGTFSLSVDGNVDMSGEKAVLTYTGALDSDISRLVFAGMPKAVDKATAHIAFTEKTLIIKALEAVIGASSFTLSGTVNDYTGDPSVAITTKGGIDLADIKGAVPLPEGIDVSGALSFDVALNGKPSDPAGFKADGGAAIKKVTAVLPKVFMNPAEFNGTVAFTPSSVRVDNLTMLSGKSDLRFDGAVTNYMTLAGLGKEDAVFNGTVKSMLIDLQNLIVTNPNTTIKPWDLEEPLKNAPIPPKLSCDIRLLLSTVTFGKLKADAVKGALLYRNGIAELEGLDIAAYGGSLAGSAALRIANPDSIAYMGKFALKSLDSGKFIADFFNTGDILRGKLSGSLGFNGAGLDSTSMVNNLRASGDMSFVEGQVVNWGLIKKLGEVLPFLAFDTLDFESVKNTFRVENQKFITPDMAVRSKHGDARINGYTGFDRKIDYDITVTLDKATSKKALGVLSALTKFADATPDRLELGVRAGGTLTSPSFVVDTSAAEKILVNGLADRAGKEVNKLLESEDGKKLQDKGKKLLDNLFKK